MYGGNLRYFEKYAIMGTAWESVIQVAKREV